MESIIQRALKLLLDKFGADYDCVTVSEDNGRYVANIETDNPSFLIGKHGAIINALQIILKNLLFAQNKENLFVSIDIDGYCADQEEKLIERVKKSIDFMREKNLPEVKLFPMTPNTRRVVHLWVASNFPELTTESVKQGDKRVVRVFYK